MARGTAVGLVAATALLAACSGDPQPRSAGAPSSSTGPTASVDPGVVREVSRQRIMADVRAIATGPRDTGAGLPAARAAASYVDAELAAAGLDVRRTDVTRSGVTLPVVWAEIEGSECAERVFVVTGHYDTVPGTPGADDDASGVAGMLETARILAGAGLPASVVVAAVPFEESMDYAGSRALAAELTGRAGTTVVGMVSAEMLGYALPPEEDPESEGDVLNVVGYDDTEALVDAFRGAEAMGGAEVVGESDSSTSYVGRSDHAAFHDAGVRGVMATDGANFRTPHYHQPSDTPDNIVPGFFTRAVRTLVKGTVTMAARACAG